MDNPGNSGGTPSHTSGSSNLRKQQSKTKKAQSAGNLGGVSHVGNGMKTESHKLPFGMVLETAAPMSPITKRILSQCRAQTKHWKDANGNGDDVFKASKVKATSVNPTRQYHEHGLPHQNGENLEEGLRLKKTYCSGNKTAKVYRDHEWEEYRVKHFVDGKHQKKADYHTNDRDDAHNTAKHWLNKSALEEGKYLDNRGYPTVKKKSTLGYRVIDKKAIKKTQDEHADILGAANDFAGRVLKRLGNRLLRREEVEQIDEISRRALGQYVQGARKDFERLNTIHRHEHQAIRDINAVTSKLGYDRTSLAIRGKLNDAQNDLVSNGIKREKKITKRGQYIDKAIDRMSREK